jgi:hypothetical protein
MTTDYDPTVDPVDPTMFPADKHLESSVLGAVLLDPDLMNQLDFLQPDDFFESPHRRVFEIMREIWEGGILPIDPMIISDRDIGLLSVCLEAQINCPSPILGVPYAKRVKELAVKRKFIPVLQRAAEMSMNGASFDSIREYMIVSLDSEERRSVHQTWQLSDSADLIEPPAPREWLIDGLLYRGQITMFFGPPGIRKTLFLMDMCASLALGENWLMRQHNQPDHKSLATFHTTRAANILWLDYDNGQFETQIRIRAAMMGRNGLGQGTFRYMSEGIPWLALDNASHVRKLITMALDMQSDVIVIDALGMVMGEVDENSPAVASVIAKLKEIRAATGAAILVVHHPSKSGAQTLNASTYNASGSAKFSNFFEWTIELRSGEEQDIIAVEVVKNRGWAKHKKFAAEFTYEHFGHEHPELAHELKSFRFYPAAVESKGEQRDAAVQEAITDALAGGEMNQKDLVACVKADVLDDAGIVAGEVAIRDVIKNMVANKAIVLRQSAPRQPVFYALPGYVDSVDLR